MSIIEQLEAAGEVLTPSVRAAVEGLEAMVAKLEERIRELEAQLGLNSSNSSKPPSSDGPSVVRQKKKLTGKKRGGQPGHPGHHRQQIPAERVEQVVEHWPKSCEHCGHTLSGAEEAKPAQVHQVVELPRLQAEVTEHRRHCMRCPQCRKLTRASLPAEVGGKHFGPRLVALGSQLIGRYRLSRRETVDLLGRILGVAGQSLGSTEAFTQEASAALKPVYEEVQARVRQSEAAGVDETSWKLGGKKQWLWTAVVELATLFRVDPKRGSEALERFLGSRYAGVVNSDRWNAYRIYERRQLCWAHLLRNFKALELRGGAAAEFSEQGVAQCGRVFEMWWGLQEGRHDWKELGRGMEPIQVSFRRLLEGGAESSDKKVAGFCRNLLKLWPSLWTFVTEPVEPTNNAAERALRAAVLWRKGCFGSQGEAGLRYAERILTLNATCRQQQIHPIDFLYLLISAFRSGTSAPKLLPTH